MNSWCELLWVISVANKFCHLAYLLLHNAGYHITWWQKSSNVAQCSWAWLNKLICGIMKFMMKTTQVYDMIQYNYDNIDFPLLIDYNIMTSSWWHHNIRYHPYHQCYHMWSHTMCDIMAPFYDIISILSCLIAYYTWWYHSLNFEVIVCIYDIMTIHKYHTIIVWYQ